MHDADADGVAGVGLAARRVVARRPQPLGDQPDAHHDVAERDDGEVALVERPRHAGGEDQHAGDLHEHADSRYRTSSLS